uniref:Cell division protein n=1 Tax=Capsosiphon fulvescens TaxID=205396 RepID=A0A3G1RIS9_9CHLO|nr:cell division protein [Capsosiphon fulvescens]AWX64032.1 cell division protein [Capsosiphon fulvescens]AYV89949.1 cell division protein [Capsosiphon fulvescens]
MKKPLNTSKLHAKVNSEKWEKPFLWTYYLADAYKKTLRVKINQYFNPETTNYFIFASLPFLIYLGQLSNAKYNKYKNNLLFQKTLPGLTSEIPKVSWETLNYTQYKKSLNLNNINHIYYSDNNAFITLNPKWSSEQNSWYVGTFRPDQDMQRKSNGVYQPPNLGINSQAIDYVSRFDWFSIPSRNFTRQYKKSINNQNVNWNFLFHASDDIPSKLQSIYSWSIISQAGFLYIVLLFFAIVQNEYREELLNYVKTFSIYLSDNAKQRLQSASIDDNYRVIRNSKVSLKSVVGSESILPIFANLILYLISARHIASKIFLLVGPPGTGKTLLVSALAGEAQVPVIIEYGKMFQTDFEQHGGDKLKMVFEAAKSISPCLLFLDEIDKIGKRRSHVVLYTSSIESEAQMPNTLNFPYLQNGIGESDSLFSSSFSKVDQYDIPTRSKSNLLESSVSRSNGIETMGPLQTTIQENQISMSKQNSQDVMMLTQLLNQVDGLTDHRNIIVIGATNRPTILDPALTRPGRFDKVIYLDLPGKRKRLDLFKFYSSPGHDSSLNNDLEMNWNYFAKQTSGLSAAHISAAMNRSLLKVIYSSMFGDDLFICREAYYLSGQCLMYAVLPEKAHFSPGNLWSLSTGKDSMRSIGFDKVLKSLISQFNTKAQYEYYLLFLISGKVSETLMLINNDSKNDSSLGNESLKIVGQMILFMRDKYLFYSPKLLTRKQIKFNLLQNTLQLPSQEDYALLQGMTGFSEIQNQSNISFPEKGIRRYDLSFNLDKPWWQLKSFYQISSISRKYGQWYRIFLTDSIQNYRNIEWVPPEKHYHNQTNTSFNFEKALTTDQVLIFFSFEFLNWISTNSQSLRFFKDHLNYYFDLFNHVLSILLIESNPDAKLWENLNWNSIELFQESNLMSNLVFELFNDSFELLETNRSFLDCLVYLLLCNSSISDFSRESYSNRFFPSKSISE